MSKDTKWERSIETFSDEQLLFELAACVSLRQAIADAEKQEPVRLQCTTCGTVYAEGVPPQEAEKQEPVAWMREDEDCTDCIVWEQTEEHTIPLYTSPPQRQPLTEEQRDEIARQADENDWHDYDLIDAVEAAHNIKGGA
jgi:hypothetical protein